MAVIKNTTPNRALQNSNHPLAYMGVNPSAPAEAYSISRAPTVNDWQGYLLLDTWLDTSTDDVWILVSLDSNQAKWIMFAGGSGDVLGVLADNGVIAIPILGILQLNALSQAGSSVSFSASTNLIRLNTTDANSNTLIGLGAGNHTLTGSQNSGLGQSALAGLTTGTLNSALGLNSLTLLTTGTHNTAIGTALGALLTGSYNVALGYNSGASYTGAESSNVDIANTGTLGESNTIHIGTFGTGNGQQNQTYLNGGTVNIPSGPLALPTTTSSVGFITINGNRFISNYLNTPAVGINSGNFTATGLFGSAFGNNALTSLTSGASNSAFGNAALESVTSGGDNSCFGYVSGALITTSSRNSCFGSGAGDSIITGASNTFIGYVAGTNYVGAESNNICIGASVQGTVGESNVTRIGNGNTVTTYITGAIVAPLGSISAGADTGGVVSTTTLSNANSTTISTGVGSVKMSSANAATNTAWIKIYVGTTAYWIPAWTTNSP